MASCIGRTIATARPAPSTTPDGPVRRPSLRRAVEQGRINRRRHDYALTPVANDVDLGGVRSHPNAGELNREVPSSDCTQLTPYELKEQTLVEMAMPLIVL
jgi:hypothetical protein